MRSGRKGQAGRVGHELSGQPGQVSSCESPVDGRSHALVVLLEAQQSVLDLRDAAEVIGSEGLALNDGEVDLDLIEPAGVNRSVDEYQVRPTGAQKGS